MADVHILIQYAGVGCAAESTITMRVTDALDRVTFSAHIITTRQWGEVLFADKAFRGPPLKEVEIPQQAAESAVFRVSFRRQALGAAVLADDQCQCQSHSPSV